MAFKLWLAGPFVEMPFRIGASASSVRPNDQDYSAILQRDDSEETRADKAAHVGKSLF